MVIQHNLASMNASRVFKLTDYSSGKVSEKLGSGYRINRGADDAAGLAISEKMRRQVRGLAQASVNAQDGISMVQTVEGALSEVHEMLHRLNELSVQGGNDTLEDQDRDYLNGEISKLKDEIDRVGSTSVFNEIHLLNGDPQGGIDEPLTVRLQVGTEDDDEQTISFDIEAINSTKLGINDVSASSSEQSRNSIDIVKNAIEEVSSQRSDLGAIQNRLEHSIRNLDNVDENTAASESRIRDMNMAKAMVEHSKFQILIQSQFALMTNARQSNAGVMALLQ